MLPVEADFGQTGLRFALGGGALYRTGTTYDPSGYRGLHITDTRFAAALRVSFKGLFAQGEYLQAVESDPLNGRPRIARGAYGEASYLIAASKKLGLAPLARLGWSVQDENFFPLHIVTGHVGLAAYPASESSPPGTVRFVLEYQSERHIEEGETAYGGLFSVMVRF
jgi:hypothetical protein